MGSGLATTLNCKLNYMIEVTCCLDHCNSFSFMRVRVSQQWQTVSMTDLYKNKKFEYLQVGDNYCKCNVTTACPTTPMQRVAASVQLTQITGEFEERKQQRPDKERGRHLKRELNRITLTFQIENMCVIFSDGRVLSLIRLEMYHWKRWPCSAHGKEWPLMCKLCASNKCVWY